MFVCALFGGVAISWTGAEFCYSRFNWFSTSSVWIELAYITLAVLCLLVGMIVFAVGAPLLWSRIRNSLMLKYVLSATGQPDTILWQGGCESDKDGRVMNWSEPFMHRLRVAVSRFGDHHHMVSSIKQNTHESIARCSPVSSFVAGDAQVSSDRGLSEDSTGAMRSQKQETEFTPWWFHTLTCKCCVHPFALRCNTHGTPNTWPKKADLAITALGLLGVYGIFFGDPGSGNASLTAIGASATLALTMKLAKWWYAVPRDGP